MVERIVWAVIDDPYLDVNSKESSRLRFYSVNPIPLYQTF